GIRRQGQRTTHAGNAATPSAVLQRRSERTHLRRQCEAAECDYDRTHRGVERRVLSQLLCARQLRWSCRSSWRCHGSLAGIARRQGERRFSRSRAHRLPVLARRFDRAHGAMTMHKLDLALARTFPITTVPKYGAFEPLAESGQRLLVAANGFF